MDGGRQEAELTGAAQFTGPPSIIVIGLGNPILGDDGVGWVVAQAVEKRLAGYSGNVEVECFAMGGLSLMEHLLGHQRAILIDAGNPGSAPTGSLYQFDLAELPERVSGRLASSHDVSLQTALAMGSRLGAVLPERITVVGIETEAIYNFSEELSPPVAAAVPEAVEIVLQLIENTGCLHPKENHPDDLT